RACRTPSISTPPGCASRITTCSTCSRRAATNSTRSAACADRSLPGLAQHIADHHGDGVVKLDGDGLVQLDPAQRLRQHRIGLDEDAMLLGEGDDPFGEEAAPAGDDPRRFARSLLIAESHGQRMVVSGPVAHRVASTKWPEAAGTGWAGGAPVRTTTAPGIRPAASSSPRNASMPADRSRAVS